MVDPILRAENIFFRYSSNGRLIINDVSLEIPEGMITSLIGPNGSGKTTLFNILNGSLIPERGCVTFRGQSLSSFNIRERSRFISNVHQYHPYVEKLLTRDLILMGRTPYQNFMSTVTSKDMEVVERCAHLTDTFKFLDQDVDSLSGGMMQRVWLAQALAQEPQLIFLDEPTTFLDIRSQFRFLDTIRKFNKELNLTVIMINHDLNQVMNLSDRVISLKNGSILDVGSPENVITENSISELFDVSSSIIKNGDTSSIIFHG